jgi:hypothetical protein
VHPVDIPGSSTTCFVHETLSTCALALAAGRSDSAATTQSAGNPARNTVTVPSLFIS